MDIRRKDSAAQVEVPRASKKVASKKFVSKKFAPKKFDREYFSFRWNFFPAEVSLEGKENCGQGDRMDELKWRVAREVPHLRRFAFALTGRREAADDLVQDALERAWKKRHLRRQGGALRPWLFKIMYRVFLNGRRRAVVAQEEFQDEVHGLEECSGLPAQEMRLRMDDMRRALDALPGEQRAAVVLVALEGVSYDQAANMIGVPVGTLRSRLFRGREKLQGLMRGEGRMAPRLRRVK